MTKGRLEAFSDGVIAIIITIMVLEMKVPHGSDFVVLQPLIPVILSYILSFLYVGIYWNNHHHLLHTANKIDGSILWANLHLLFWLSLIPFVTGWMGENNFKSNTMVLYGVILLMASIAYFILQNAIIAKNGKCEAALAKALGKNIKGKISSPMYVVGISAAFMNNWISAAIYFLVAIMWLVPNKRIEKAVDS